MRIFLGILKILAVVVLVLLITGAALYYFGSFKLVEQQEIVLPDGKTIEYKVQDSWCGLPGTTLNLKLPANIGVIKRGPCKIKDVAKPVKLSHLIQVRGNLLEQALEEQQMIGMCATNSNGLSGYQKDGAIYCISSDKVNPRGVAAFKKVSEKYIVSTSFFLLPELDRVAQLKELEALVNSYKVKE